MNRNPVLENLGFLNYRGILILHFIRPVSNLFPLFFHTLRGVKPETRIGILNSNTYEQYYTQKKGKNEMKASLNLIRFYTIQLKFGSLIAFFEKLVSRLPSLTRPTDDPAALRYMVDKYNGELD